MVSHKLIAFLSILALISSQSSSLPSSSSTPDVINNLNELRQAELARHNKYRADHGAPPLVLSDSLNNMAQAYALTLFQAHAGIPHSAAAVNGLYGENIFWSWGSSSYNFPADGPSGNWYSEIKDYNFVTG